MVSGDVGRAITEAVSIPTIGIGAGNRCEAQVLVWQDMAGLRIGLLTASLVTETGGQIGWLATGMSFEFKRPVYTAEQITCQWPITDITERGHA